MELVSEQESQSNLQINSKFDLKINKIESDKQIFQNNEDIRTEAYPELNPIINKNIKSDKLTQIKFMSELEKINDVTKKVKKMYIDYTYPQYNTTMDTNAPIVDNICPTLYLESINHFIYQGKKNFDNYRILFAGCGLGPNILSCSYLLRNHENIELVGIDLSSSSLRIAKKRAKLYGFKNIKFIEMSLFDLNEETHGKFDLILSIGVLHHLHSPSEGLNSLKRVLKDDGSMQIMVYGKIGRTSVYQMQELMKCIHPDEDDNQVKLRNFKNVYLDAPITNWFKLRDAVCPLIGDHLVSDNGIVDEILHVQDRAYTIPELYDWVKNSDMNIVDFEPMGRYKYKYTIPHIDYTNINDIEKMAINELFYGDFIKHQFSITKNTNINTKAEFKNLDNILIFNGINQNCIKEILDACKKEKQFQIEISPKWALTNKIVLGSSKYKLNLTMNDYIAFILQSIDNKTSTKDIFIKLRYKFNPVNAINNKDNKDTKEITDKKKELSTTINNLLSDQFLIKMFQPIFDEFEMYDMILLKHPDCNMKSIFK